LKAAGLMAYLEELGFYLVGYGCTTCIGNSGPMASPEVEAAVENEKLNVVAVLSGNRNFEGRIHPLVRASYLASPPLVVAYALAGDIRRDLSKEPVGSDREGKDVYLRELWPSAEEVNEAIRTSLKVEMFTREYARIFDGDENWQRMSAPTGPIYEWDPKSTYVREPSFFEGIGPQPDALTDIIGARTLVILGDSITTDHISPAGSIPPDSPAGPEYGSGSSRDWAAKGPLLLGVRAVIAESFERIHRSNLVGMGILPLQFQPGESLKSLGLEGTEAFTIRGLEAGLKPGQRVEV